MLCTHGRKSTQVECEDPFSNLELREESAYSWINLETTNPYGNTRTPNNKTHQPCSTTYGTEYSTQPGYSIGSLPRLNSQPLLLYVPRLPSRNNNRKQSQRTPLPLVIGPETFSNARVGSYLRQSVQEKAMKRGRGRTFCFCEWHEEVTGRVAHGSMTDYLSYPLSVRGSQQLFMSASVYGGAGLWAIDENLVGCIHTSRFLVAMLPVWRR